MKNIKQLLAISLSVALFSCAEEEKPYEVNSSLAPYLDRFVSAAKERGKNFNMRDEGIIMEFADLEEPTIGLCYRTDPITVQIDREYWEKTSNSANKEDLREQVVFHELAHGLLMRNHKNNFLPNTEWASIMCGGEIPDNRFESCNFSGFRKKYYLDELFNEKTPAPEWATSAGLDFDDRKGSRISFLDYSLSKDSTDTSIPNMTTVIADGYCTIISERDYATMYSIFARSTANFYFEAFINADFSSEYATTGLWIGNENSQDAFIINSANRMYVYNTENIIYSAEIYTNKYFDLNGDNKVAVRCENNIMQMYINDKLAYISELTKPEYNILGIYVGVHSTVKIKEAFMHNLDETKSNVLAGDSSALPIMKANKTLLKNISK